MKITEKQLRQLIKEEFEKTHEDDELVKVYAEHLAIRIRHALRVARTERIPNEVINQIAYEMGEDNMPVPSRYEDVNSFASSIAHVVLEDTDLYRFVEDLAKQTLREALKPV